MFLPGDEGAVWITKTYYNRFDGVAVAHAGVPSGLKCLAMKILDDSTIWYIAPIS